MTDVDTAELRRLAEERLAGVWAAPLSRPIDPSPQVAVRVDVLVALLDRLERAEGLRA